jgi:hypothetical protein
MRSFDRRRTPFAVVRRLFVLDAQRMKSGEYSLTTVDASLKVMPKSDARVDKG